MSKFERFASICSFPPKKSHFPKFPKRIKHKTFQCEIKAIFTLSLVDKAYFNTAIYGEMHI